MQSIMARTAVTLSISMSAEVRRLVDVLRGERSPSEYVRDLIERDAARRALDSQEIALREIARAQALLPESWLVDEWPDPDELREPGDVSPLVGASVDMSGLAQDELRSANQ